MPPIGFQWDLAKARANLAKHDVSFDLAVLAFEDDYRATYLDDREDYGEDRWLTVAMVTGRLITVCYTERGLNVRIISAWKANRHEQDTYFAVDP